MTYFTKLVSLLIICQITSISLAAKVEVKFLNNTVYNIEMNLSPTGTESQALIPLRIEPMGKGTIKVNENELYKISVVYRNEENYEDSFSRDNMRLSDVQYANGINITTIDAYSKQTGKVPFTAKFNGSKLVKIPKNVTTSNWSSTFTVNGNRVAASIRFNGSSGTYRTDGINGSFKEVVYYKEGNNYLISGKWYANNQYGGRIYFKVPSRQPTTFTGKFTGNGGGSWNGSRR